MKVFFTYQGIDEKHFYEFDVSSSLTVAELIKYDEINQIISNLDHEVVIAVNSELLDGNFKPLPNKYRLKDCLLYTSPSPRDYAASRMPSSA